jgi:hypothetical protein
MLLNGIRIKNLCLNIHIKIFRYINMNEKEHDFDEENDASPEEQQKIEKIIRVCYRQTQKPEPEQKQEKSTSVWSWFGLNNVEDAINAAKAAAALSRAAAPFDPIRRVGISKVVTISNISGKNAWVVLSPSRITAVSSIGIDKLGQLALERSGELKGQQISIPDESSGEYDLDNGLSYVSLFLNIDGTWKKVWIDRLFNTRKYNINILPKHIKAAIDYNFKQLE